MNSSAMIKQGYREARSPRLRATTVTLHVDQVGLSELDRVGLSEGLVGQTLRHYYEPGTIVTDKLGRW